MGYFANRKARKAREQRAAEVQRVVQRDTYYNHNSNYGLDPVTAAVLYTSPASGEVDEDKSDQSDDVAVDDTAKTEYTPTYEPTPSPTEDRSTGYWSDSSSSDSSSSYSSSSYDSGSSSSYDSGSSSSSDSGGGGSFD